VTQFVAVAHPREPIPDSRLGSARSVFFIVTGSLCGLPVFVLAGQIQRSLGPRDATVAYLLGGAISGLLGAGSVYSGARTRHNLAMLSERSFGNIGSHAVRIVVSTCLVGWVGVILSVLGTTAADALGTMSPLRPDPMVVSYCAAVVVALIALRGVGALEKAGLVIAPLLAVLLLLSVRSACPILIPHVELERADNLSLGAAVSAVVGMYIVGIVVQPDYGRFVRAPIMAALSSGLALAVAFPGILIFSALPATRCGARDLIAVLISQGFGQMALALLVLGAWIDASVSLAGLNWSSQHRLRLCLTL
jgi:cytosine permease